MGLILALGAAPAEAQTEAATRGLQRFEYSEAHMGVRARVVLYAENEDAALGAARLAFERIEVIEQAISSWRADSELARLVRGNTGEQAGQSWHVSGELLGVLSLANGFGALTEGAFDVTGAPVYRLWKEAQRANQWPDERALEAALARVGHERLSVDPRSRTVALAANTEVDLGGIGKGYACDQAFALLRRLGYPHALVELGGDLFCGSAPPGKSGWRVAAGEAGADGEHQILELVDRGVATSGDSEQFIERDGVRYSHIVDPRSGQPVTHGRTVTIVAESAAAADALASACSVLDEADSAALMERFPSAERFVQDDRDGDDSEGWVTLFDGTSMDGWTTTGGRYDGPAVWTIEDGALTGRTDDQGHGGLIYTERSYSSFEIEFDCHMDYPFDSGVFVRMRPPSSGLKGAQVTLDHRPGGEIGAIYADGFLEHNTEGEQAYNRGEWNRVKVRCTGFDFRLQTWINGVQIGDYQLPPNTPGYAPSGLVGLQVHGADPKLKDHAARFKNVRIRELSAFEDAGFEERTEPAAAGLLTIGERATGAGWEDLFAGGLEGWEALGTQEGYAVNNGVLQVPARGGGHLVTRRDFRDFELRMDFKISRMANSGLFLRGARDGSDPAYSGCEIQILDDFNWERETNSKLAPYQFTGGLYAAVPPGSDKEYLPPGEWNTYEVVYRGDRLAVALNGRTLYDVRTSELEAQPPFAERAPEGFLGIQRYGAPGVQDASAIEVRNCFVRELEAPAAGE
ncbi:MAG: family 16 glycoside hydrolase [Planctomycetota bacterium]|jgi:thiamine biosynthesis lipoprotein